MKNVGLFFGSFNPVHIGHMAIANYMLEFTPMDELWFIVSPHNPLKKKDTLLESHHRLELVRLAIGDHFKMRASDIEFGLPQPSYTINTLAYLREKYPDVHFILIMGGDNLATFHKWKNYEQILEHFSIYLYSRHEQEKNELASHPSIKQFEAPRMEISSTFIRNAIKDNKDVRYFMPPAAWEYCREMHFYEK